MSDPQDPQQGSQRPTPPEWETTEFPAFTGFPDFPENGPGYGSSATPYDYGQQPPATGSEYSNPFAAGGYPAQPEYLGQPAQPGYPGQQGQPAQPGYPAAPWTPAPPARSRRTPLLIGAAVVVIAALVIGGLLLFAGGDDTKSDEASNTLGRTITLPAAVAGYTKSSNFPIDSLKQQLGSALASSGTSDGTTENAQIGVYTKGSSSIPGIIFVALALKDVPRLDDQVTSLGLDAAVRKFVTGASDTANGSAPKSFTPGKLGGAMYCASGTISVEPVANCGWGDRSYFALTIVIDPASTADAAATTRSFRAAAEH